MTDAKLVRFASVLVVLAGYVFVFRSGEERIGDRLARNGEIVEQLRAGERATASRAALESERARLVQQLGRSPGNGDRSSLIAAFVRDAAAAASTRRTAITAVTAGGARPDGASAQPAPENRVAQAVNPRSPASGNAEPVDEIPLELTLEGRYADVLATVRALSAGRVPAMVDVASLARKNGGAPDAMLTAALHVVLERFVLTPAREPNGVPRQPA